MAIEYVRKKKKGSEKAANKIKQLNMRTCKRLGEVKHS